MFNYTKAVLITIGDDQPGGESYRDTVNCFHCDFTIKDDRSKDVFTCKACMQKICEVCAGKRELGDPCYPFEKRLDEFEKSLRIGMDRRTAQRIYGL